MASVGERIKLRRVELGLTQDDLARKAKISKSFLSDVENGKRMIGAAKLLDIAGVLGLSLDFLMMGGDAPAKPAEVQVAASLAEFAEREGLTFREVNTLMKMRELVASHLAGSRSDPNAVDWGQFYEVFVKFLR